MVDRRNTPAEEVIRLQLQSEEESRPTFFSFQTVYSRKFQIILDAPSFDLPFGTVMTNLKLFHVVEENVPCWTNFRDQLP